MVPLLELPYAQRPNHAFLTLPMTVRSHDGDLLVSDARDFGGFHKLWITFPVLVLFSAPYLFKPRRGNSEEREL
jgi:hypothetical protein